VAVFPVSDHRDGRRFFNPHGRTDRSIRDLLRWWREGGGRPWPRRLAGEPDRSPLPGVDRGAVALTFIGHSTFLIRTPGFACITDPVFTTHAGPFGLLGPRRVRPPARTIDALPSLDAVLLSHNHYDHLQPRSLRATVSRSSAVVVAPLGLGRFLRRHGAREVVELDWWESARVKDASITAVPAQHFSARTPWDRNRTLWCGYVIETPDATVYFVGDSGYSPDFCRIGERFPRIDAALVPIGAYEPRWFMKPMHVNPAEAVQIHLDVRAAVSMAMHFGTFRLTDEGIDEPVRELREAMAEAGIDPAAFRVLEWGETATIRPASR
jgi:L-ascorbate metabolism protein UlaG (beta-lactamase superfamily)